jgi:hypothetical protein
VGQSTTFEGMIVTDPAIEEDLSGYMVDVEMYNEPTCSTEGYHVGYLDTYADGSFGPAPLPLGAVRTYYFDATIVDGPYEELLGLNSECVSVVVRLPGQTGDGGTPLVPPVYVDPPHFGSAYLCWNQSMVNPVAYDDNVADTMWTTGNYFEPQAILGNVVDGTNIGAYHLVCNAGSDYTKTALGLGGSGEVYDAVGMAAYHQDHPVNGNDLSVYHIWVKK